MEKGNKLYKTDKNAAAIKWVLALHWFLEKVNSKTFEGNRG